MFLSGRMLTSSLTPWIPLTCRILPHPSFIQTRLSSIISRLFSEQTKRHRLTRQCAGASLSLLLILSLLRHLQHHKPIPPKSHPHQHKKLYLLQCLRTFPVVNKSLLRFFQARPSIYHPSPLPDQALRVHCLRTWPSSLQPSVQVRVVVVTRSMS
jgi:hypothetical protein